MSRFENRFRFFVMGESVVPRMASPSLAPARARGSGAAPLSCLLHALAVLSLIALTRPEPVAPSPAEDAIEMVFAPPLELEPIPTALSEPARPVAPAAGAIAPVAPDAVERLPPNGAPALSGSILPPPDRPDASVPQATVPSPTRHAPLARAPARQAQTRAKVTQPGAPRQAVETPRPAPPAARLMLPTAIAEEQTVRPAYPESARRRGEQGEVLLRVDVAADGHPIAVSVARTSGYITLDEAAAAAVRSWHFRPATRDGLPIAASADVPVRFHLD